MMIKKNYSGPEIGDFIKMITLSLKIMHSNKDAKSFLKYVKVSCNSLEKVKTK
jgi:hypothetical protein